MGFYPFFVLYFLLLQVDSYCQNAVKPKLNWSMQDPLEQKVFIENKEGQFDKQITGNEQIFYKTTLKGADIYFTDKGILYCHDEQVKLSSEKATDPDRVPVKNIRHIAEFKWKGANSSAQFIPEEEVSFYYTYSMDSKHTIVAHAFKKLVCQDLYPGIDVEYAFPEGGNSLSCSIHLHLGADSSDLKLVYDGVVSSPLNGAESITVKNDVGDFTLSLNGGANAFNNNGDEIGISAKAASIAALWFTNPGFARYNAMYDLCYDDSGNVYVYGGNYPYQLAKINNSGNLKWIHTVTFSIPVRDSTQNYYYGDFVTDKTTGTSYLGQGLNDANGPEIVKVNSSGKVEGSINLGPFMTELWRMDLSYCTHQIIIGGGGINSMAQAAVVDTSLSGLNIVNVLNDSDGKHDIAVLTSDKNYPYCYMATAVSNNLTSDFDNVLLKCPLTSLVPPVYINYEHYAFVEIASNAYVDNVSPSSGSYANGVNGIVATANNIYMWDGSLLSRINKSTGNITISNNTYPNVKGLFNQQIVTYGGIDADKCENVYIGDHANIDIADTNLTITSVIPLPSSGDTVYDVHISPQGNLYACGYGFVASYFIPQSAVTINKSTSPACSGCKGTAYVSLSSCGTGDYSWSNGATGQFVTDLCAGTYTVSVRLDCSTVISDTVNIQPSPNPSVTIPGADVKQISCFDEHDGSAVALASGGTPPYTYRWYPSNITNDTITNLSPGTYTFIVTDIHGCASIDTVTISQPSLLGVTASVSSAIQVGENAMLTATVTGGTPPYTYTWSGNLSGAAINVSPANITTYTVVVTDKDGCTSTASVTVDVLCGDVFIPDAFSPNGSNNQYFYVRGDCITDMSFLIFDRWGNKVFESNSLSKPWDGTYKGQPMNPGAFVWYLNATLKDGTKIERKGNVTLVR